MISLDDVDAKILNILAKDSRTSYMKIARIVGLSEAGVRKRVEKLIKSGVIKRFTIELGQPVMVKAVTLIATEPSADTTEISTKVREVHGVEKVYEVTGVYDLVVIISSLNISEANRCIDELRRIRGVKSTNTMMVLREW